MTSVKRTNTLAAILIALCCLITGCAYRQIRDEEKKLLITVRSLEALGLIMETPAGGESFIAKKNLDDSIEIEYEYDSEKNPGSREDIMIKSEAEILETVELATDSFSDRWSAYNLGSSLSGSEAKLVEDQEHTVIGDESYSSYFEGNGRRLGNVLVVRKDNIVLALLITGIYINDELLHDLMSPVLEEIDDTASEMD